MNRNPDFLFYEYDLHSLIEAHKQAMLVEVGSMDSNRLLNTNPDELANYLEQKYHANVPKLGEQSIQVDQTTTQVDVSQDHNRFFHDRSQPFYIEGTVITYYVPFEGDKDLFKCKPSTFTFNPPRAKATEGQIAFEYTITDHDVEKVKTQFGHDLEEVKKWLGWIANDVAQYNNQLKADARSRIDARREKLLKDQGLVANLGFPIRQRDKAPHTYVVPTVKRKIEPVIPAPGATPFVPEPALEMKEYEHILSVISNMVLVMERSPGAFRTMDEEALRMHFLVQLNGQYEGRATGETFNFDGKTDILIRENGKNIFIAECKFWRGPEEMKKALDQLLGYATWRDGKLALLVFNRDRSLTTILSKFPEVVKSHANFKKQIEYKVETGFRFILNHRDDASRELTLTILIFEVPA